MLGRYNIFSSPCVPGKLHSANMQHSRMLVGGFLSQLFLSVEWCTQMLILSHDRVTVKLGPPNIPIGFEKLPIKTKNSVMQFVIWTRNQFPWNKAYSVVQFEQAVERNVVREFRCRLDSSSHANLQSVMMFFNWPERYARTAFGHLEKTIYIKQNATTVFLILDAAETNPDH